MHQAIGNSFSQHATAPQLPNDNLRDMWTHQIPLQKVECAQAQCGNAPNLQHRRRSAPCADMQPRALLSLTLELTVSSDHLSRSEICIGTGHAGAIRAGQLESQRQNQGPPESPT